MSKSSKIPNLLLTLAFLADLLTPILIWKGIVPGGFRWISHVAIVIMIALVPFRMLAFNRIPFSFWIIIILSLVGIFSAFFSGQGIAPTIWGWWLMFQYPLVCLFTFLQPEWPKGFPKFFLTVITATLALEVLVQSGQYLAGEIPGDNLAGTFGDHGTGNLVIFLILVVCFAFGDWIQNRRWIFLAPSLIFGFLASILGEMKLFLPVLAILGILTMFFYAVKSKRFLDLIPYSFLLTFLLVIFIPVYDLIVPSATEIPVDRYFYDQQLVDKYLNFSIKSPDMRSNYYDLGRNYAASYGWNQIKDDPFTLVFGYGIGARSESKTLGIVGRALTQGNLGITAGTSMLIITQETGLLGMVTLLVFMIVVITSLLKQINFHTKSDANGLRYGLIIFTILWPLWLWYNTAWSLRVPMLLYWAILGYVIGRVESEPYENLLIQNLTHNWQMDKAYQK